MTPPGQWDLVAEVLGSDGVGPAGLTATNMLSGTTQIPAREHVAIVGRRRALDPDRYVVHTSTNRARLALSFWEIALLEAARRDAPDIESPQSFAQKIGELIAGGHIRFNAVVEAARTEPDAACRLNLELLRNRRDIARAIFATRETRRGR